MAERRRDTLSSRCNSLPITLPHVPIILQILIHREDKTPDSGAQSINSSDDDSLAETGTDEEDDGVISNNQEDQDPDGVMPDDLADPKSPIEGLQQFDWGSVDAELEEFMASGSDGDESDTSVASRKHISNITSFNKKIC